jgi:molybdate transport system regulatory protein
VKLELSDGSVVFGSITNDAIESLGLAEGEKAVAVIKSTDVMVGVE